MVFDRFRKKKRRRSTKSLQSEIAALNEEEDWLDTQIQLDKTKKRVTKKRRSQSTLGKLGRGFVSAADTVFGGPPPKTDVKAKSKKKKEEDDFWNYLI